MKNPNLTWKVLLSSAIRFAWVVLPHPRGPKMQIRIGGGSSGPLDGFI